MYIIILTYVKTYVLINNDIYSPIMSRVNVSYPRCYSVKSRSNTVDLKIKSLQYFHMNISLIISLSIISNTYILAQKPTYKNKKE